MHLKIRCCILLLLNNVCYISGFAITWSDTDARQLLHETISATATISSNIQSRDNNLLYNDPDGLLPLSPEQKRRFHRWARPSEIARIRFELGLTDALRDPVIIRSISHFNIKQQYIQNCSFIASLCICAAFERRFKKRVITSILHPQTEDREPVYNPNGKYIVKLWVNGVERAVTIDDYLPLDKDGNLLCSNTDFTVETRTTNVFESELELWVCLIEKAYMKLCGGYNFAGSNSGVDLFALTGWIPERIIFAKDPYNIKDYEIDPERVFDRILSASAYGDCLITVSTDLHLRDLEAKVVGLVPGHAYAVLDVIKTRKGQRLLRLKNPWADESWKGRYSSNDYEAWSDVDLRIEIGYDPLLSMEEEDDGIFWVCWQDILVYFQNFYLSWNPDLFAHRRVAHGFWPYDQGPIDDSVNVSENPQYMLTFLKQEFIPKTTLWILISRHIARQELQGHEANDYLTAHLHRNKGPNDRIWYNGKNGNCVQSGVYTNSPHVLIRYDMEGPHDKFLTAVLSQYKRSTNDVSFTISCYCTQPFELNEVVDNLVHVEEFRSEWTRPLSGGPVGRPTFHLNPMFAMFVTMQSRLGSIVQMVVETNLDSAVNIMCFPVLEFRDGVEDAIDEPVMDSGNYRFGLTVTEKDVLLPGPYVLVVSNYDEYDLSSFRMKVLSNENLYIERIQ